MRKRSLTLVFLVGASAAAEAQDVLTPTDILEFGQVSGTAEFQFVGGSGSAVNKPVFDLDLDLAIYRILFEAGVGLGMGVEVEISIPYQIQGGVEGDGPFLMSRVDLEDKDSGFGDLRFSGNYRILKEDATKPQLIAGPILIAPTGNDKRGQPEIDGPSGTIQEGREGGIGEGVWSTGAGAGLSKRMGDVEPYLLATYILGGKRERNDVNEDRSDVGTITLGAEWHANPEWRIDTRVFLQFNGEDVTEEALAKKREESHREYGAQAQLYVTLGSGATLIFGGGATSVEDHKTDKAAGTGLEDAIVWSLQIGLHLVFSGGP